MSASASWPSSAAAPASSIGCDAPSRNENGGVAVELYVVRIRASAKPAARTSAADQVLEHDDVAAVDQHELEVAPPHRPAGPPAVLDDPVLEHRLDRQSADHRGHAALARAAPRPAAAWRAGAGRAGAAAPSPATASARSERAALPDRALGRHAPRARLLGRRHRRRVACVAPVAEVAQDALLGLRRSWRALLPGRVRPEHRAPLGQPRVRVELHDPQRRVGARPPGAPGGPPRRSAPAARPRASGPRRAAPGRARAGRTPRPRARSTRPARAARPAAARA